MVVPVASSESGLGGCASGGCRVWRPMFVAGVLLCSPGAVEDVSFGFGVLLFVF